MSRSTAKKTIIVTGLITAAVHLVYLNFFVMEKIDVLFTLNGLGYLGLLWILFNPPGFLQGQEKLVHYVFIGYTVVTIIAFFLMGGTGFGGQYFDPVGYLTKLDEAILIAALWMHMSKD